jgi:hypothetical protein
MSAELKSIRFIFSAEPSLLARVDDWRRTQADLPSRAEAVRRLLDGALKDQSSDPTAHQTGRDR